METICCLVIMHPNCVSYQDPSCFTNGECFSLTTEVIATFQIQADVLVYHFRGVFLLIIPLSIK